MKLKNQVSNFKLSKKIKELKVKQKSLFYWVKGLEISEYPEGDEYESWYEKSTVELVNWLQGEHAKGVIKDNDPDNDFCPEVYSAFTVAELGELIGEFCNEWAQGYNDSGCFYHFQFGGRGCGNMMENFGETFSALDAENEADARAMLLIHILESNK